MTGGDYYVYVIPARNKHHFCGEIKYMAQDDVLLHACVCVCFFFLGGPEGLKPHQFGGLVGKSIRLINPRIHASKLTNVGMSSIVFVKLISKREWEVGI